MKFNTAKWLVNFLAPEDNGRAERRPGGGLAAHYWWNSALRQDAVRDVSTSGVFIVTNERWALGTVIALTLQNVGYLEKSRERRISSRARVVRAGSDGVAFQFLSPDDPDVRLWDGLVESLIEHAKLADIEGVVRMASALTFLNRLCFGSPAIAEFIREQLSSHRLSIAVDIALKAQDRLSLDPAGSKLHANSRLVMRILEAGSSNDETWLRDLWAGLLVASCTADGKDDSNLAYVEQFGQFTSVPLRILTVVCKAAKFHAEMGAPPSNPIECTLEELTTITGARELQIGRDLERLAQFGLIELDKPDAHQQPVPRGVVTIQPTPGALELFARCSGHRGALEEFYAAAR